LTRKEHFGVLDSESASAPNLPLSNEVPSLLNAMNNHGNQPIRLIGFLSVKSWLPILKCRLEQCQNRSPLETTRSEEVIISHLLISQSGISGL